MVFVQALINIKQYTVRHFTVEEKLMADCNYPGLDEQLEAHASFTNRFNDFFNDFKENGLTPPLVNALNNELVDWISNHITGIDQKFGDYYQDYHSQKISSEKPT
ncbi:MAG: hemerythrin family protein [Thermodesulfobacteriota bacterium]|nr:hemerythrin family protein [Thermodesulfobacteriota bacterium]